MAGLDPKKAAQGGFGGFSQGFDFGAKVDEHDPANWSAVRRNLNDQLNSPIALNCLAFLLLVSLIVTIWEADVTSERGPLDAPIVPKPPLVLEIAKFLIVALFTIETSLRVFALRRTFFKEGWTIDGIVVVIDIIFAVCDIFGAALPSVSFLRLFRLVRLMKLKRVSLAFPELTCMVDGMLTAMASVFWGLVMIMLIVLVWSIISVHLINPIARDAAKHGRYETVGCDERCATAFSSVWNAFVVWMQTMVFGDGVAQIVVPLVEEQPWTLFFYLAALSMIGFAAMNLILATIVDSGAKEREEALERRFETQRQAESDRKMEQKNEVVRICGLLGSEDSGMINKEEFRNGLAKSKQFQQALQTFGLNVDNYEVFFNAADKDQSGKVSYTDMMDFVVSSTEESLQNTATYIKCSVMDIMQELSESREERRMLGLKIDRLGRSISNAVNGLDQVLHGDGEIDHLDQHPQNGESKSVLQQRGSRGGIRRTAPTSLNRSEEDAKQGRSQSSNGLKGTKAQGNATGKTMTPPSPRRQASPRPSGQRSGDLKDLETKDIQGENGLQTIDPEAATKAIAKLADMNKEIILLLKSLEFQSDAHTRLLRNFAEKAPPVPTITAGPIHGGLLKPHLNGDEIGGHYL